MDRVRRRLLHLATALSLLLCVAVCLLWARSFGNSESFGYYTRRDGSGWYRNIYIGSDRGRLIFVNSHQQWDHGLPRGRFLLRDAAPGSPDRPGVLGGFRYFHVEGRQMGWVEVAVPYWSVALALAAAPAWAGLGRLRRRRPQGHGFCPVTPESVVEGKG